MTTNSVCFYEKNFSREAINQQVQKILLDPSFRGADILKRFLMFIVDQTLSGNSNWLKEYTIAINVLNKPRDFRPQENGIVRIHAGRLRRSLNHYYDTLGALDQIRIRIPKGAYVPVFADNDESKITIQSKSNITNPASDDISGIIGIMPFRNSKKELGNFFIEGVCLLLSNELMQFENFSVVAYHVMRNLYAKTNDVKEIASAVHARYIISGDIQTKKDQLRVSIQMIEAHTNNQVWSNVYERKLTEKNVFELQDDIAKLTILELTRFWGSLKSESRQQEAMAVA